MAKLMRKSMVSALLGCLSGFMPLSATVPLQLSPTGSIVSPRSETSTTTTAQDAAQQPNTSVAPVPSTGPSDSSYHTSAANVTGHEIPPTMKSSSFRTDEKVMRAGSSEVAGTNNSNTPPSSRGAAATAVPPDFVVGPEDVLTIDVWKEQELSKTIPVMPDGKISLPLVGQLTVAGMTTPQIRDAIATRLKNYISSPEVAVSVQTIRSQYINVFGQVLKPGSLVLTKEMTVLDALAQAGGFKEFAKVKRIYVLRPTPDGSSVKLPFNYKEVIKGRNLSQNIPLRLHDTVVVP